MITRVALRAASGRGFLPAARLAALSNPQWTRAYARKDGPDRSTPKPPPYVGEEGGAKKSAQDISNRGPVKNQTWSPDVGIKFASEGLEYSSTEGSPEAARPSNPHVSKPPQSPPASPLHAQAPPTPPPSQPTPSNAPRRSSKLGGGMAGSTTAHSAASKPSAESTEADIDSSAPYKGPLPDLTKGIPSTFESEFLNQNKTAAKDGEQAQHPELNMTELEASEEGQGGRQGGGSGGRQKGEYVSSIDRKRNAIFRFTMIAGGAFAVVGTFFLGQNWEDAAEEQRHADAPNGYSPGLVYGRVKTRFNEMFGYYTEPAFPKLLPDSEPEMNLPQHTLVVSLEDLLVTSKWTTQKGWQVAKRPGVDYFLRYLSQYYELVLFTTVASMNGEPIRVKLDPFGFMVPLYREATKYVNGEHVKDLSYLNRDLSKTIIIDTVPAHTQLQPENAVHLPKWNGDPKDAHTNDLVAMIPFLEYLATMGGNDVRTVLKSFEGTHIPTEFAKREARAREVFNKQLEEERRKRGKMGSLTGNLSGMLGFKPSNSLMQIPGEPTLAEGLAQGKMLSDQIRERGQRQYQQLDKEIKEKGDMWLKQLEDDQKAAQEEMTKSMQGNVRGTFSGLFGSSSSSSDKK